MKQSKVTIETKISASIGKVWDFWTKPEHITRWNFAIETWHCPKALNDLRVGGKYSARMEAKDGSFGFDFEALYDEVNHHKTIKYTMLDGRSATTDFVSIGEETKVTTVCDAEESNPVEMQKSGWQAILNNFKTYVESNNAG